MLPSVLAPFLSSAHFPIFASHKQESFRGKAYPLVLRCWYEPCCSVPEEEPMAKKESWLSLPLQLSQEVDRLFDELIYRPWGFTHTATKAC
jgi:hypothetical protein